MRSIRPPWSSHAHAPRTAGFAEANDMTDSNNETESRPGMGAQLWGTMKGALIDEDPIAVARRAKLQGGRTPAEKSDATTALPVAAAPMSPMATALMNQVLGKATAYTALTEKLVALETIVVDERTRYQAA